MINNDTLDFWHESSREQLLLSNPLSLSFIQLIEGFREQQKLIDKWNEPEAAQRLTATEIQLATINLYNKVKPLEKSKYLQWQTGCEDANLIDEAIEKARLLQARQCCYGTKHGDGKACDCKYLSGNKKDYSPGGEQTGCCEARFLIETLTSIRKAFYE